ncbi:unnamed protein product [Cyclocybe aegerita]|uniref:Uncharacterized protein n=1 Tax=Cyclocybe aegerita TaxID=1973307 RepID=A0A8S0WAF9_CYCAE|nr:unnamed protein product [Cyclocybe aegerita]
MSYPWYSPPPQAQSHERSRRHRDWGRDHRSNRPPPYTNLPQESEGLLGNPQPEYGSVNTNGSANGQPAKRTSRRAFWMWMVAACIIGYLTSYHVLSSYYQSLRSGWTQEEARHADLVKQWTAEEREHDALRVKMQVERVAMNLERKRWDTEWEEHDALRLKMQAEREAMDLERKRWDKEWEEHERRKEEGRKEEEKQKEETRKEEEKRREEARKEEEKQKEDKRREEEERRRSERHEKEQKERRMREQLFWVGFGPSQCVKYGTREYSATLGGRVPLEYDTRKECYEKSAEIHGRLVKPTRCDEQDTCGRPLARWTVDFDEAACSTWWGYFHDKGCYSTGKRHFEAPLENLQSEDYWRDICGTTPATIKNVYYSSPTSCAEWGGRKWGMWDVDDGSCD